MLPMRTLLLIPSARCDAAFQITATGSLPASAPLAHHTWPDHACCIAQVHTSPEEHEGPARDSKRGLTDLVRQTEASEDFVP